MHNDDLFSGSGASLPQKDDPPGAGGTEGLSQHTNEIDFKALRRIVAALALVLALSGAGLAALTIGCADLVRRAFA